MRILQYIPLKKKDDLICSYVELLSSAMSEAVEVVTVTEKAAKTIKADEWFDIVHIHACWDMNAAMFAKRMEDRGFAVILSPHGGLEEYTIKHEQKISKQGKMFVYQRQALERVEGIIATSYQEEKGLAKLGLKKRTTVIKSALLDKSTSSRQMAELTLLFYQKVIDTRYQKLMTPSEKHAFCTILLTGVIRDTDELTLTIEQMNQVQQLTTNQWKRILLYADDENCRDLIDRGSQRLHLNVPPINTAAINRFPLDAPKAVGCLDHELYIGKNNGKLRAIDEYANKDEKTLKALCTMLLNAKKHLRDKTLSMRHLTNLFEMFRYGNYDEDKLADILKRIRLKSFTSNILQVLNEYFNLTEGFMPLKPTSHLQSKKIRAITMRE